MANIWKAFLISKTPKWPNSTTTHTHTNNNTSNTFLQKIAVGCASLPSDSLPYVQSLCRSMYSHVPRGLEESSWIGLNLLMIKKILVYHEHKRTLDFHFILTKHTLLIFKTDTATISRFVKYWLSIELESKTVTTKTTPQRGKRLPKVPLCQESNLICYTVSLHSLL